jgi:hypothetical protein
LTTSRELNSSEGLLDPLGKFGFRTADLALPVLLVYPSQSLQQPAQAGQAEIGIIFHFPFFICHSIRQGYNQPGTSLP